MIMMSGDQIITEGKEDGVCAMYGEKGNAYRVWVGKQLGRPRCGWEDNIQTYLQDIAWRGRD